MAHGHGMQFRGFYANFTVKQLIFRRFSAAVIVTNLMDANPVIGESTARTMANQILLNASINLWRPLCDRRF